MNKMDWNSITGTVFAAIASVGGAGIIIVFCVRLASNRLSEAMLKKYQSHLNKDLEHYKSTLSQEVEKYRMKLNDLTFVTQRQFDTEFVAYQALFDSLYDFSVHTSNLYPFIDQVPSDDEEKKAMYKTRYEDYCNAFNCFSETLEKNAPFIPKENYKLFSDLRSQAYTIGCMYPEVRIDINPSFELDNRTIARDNYKNTRQFNEDIDAAKDTIREYLATLKVEK